MSNPIDLNTLGGVVAFEHQGRMVMSSWVGETVCVWAKFSQAAPIGLMRQYMTEAYEYDEHERPEGCTKAICFKTTAAQ